MAADYQLTPRDYVAIGRRWALAMILTFGSMLTVFVVVALLLPKVYESTGTLLAEAPQVSGEVVRSAGSTNAEQRIQALRQRIMTRESLLRIAAEHEVFNAGDGAALKESEVVTAMRHSINVNLQIGNMPAWERPTNNFAFNVSFQHGDPEKALEVTNALVRLFLESSAQERLLQASRANDFLNQEADRVRGELENLERQIATFKRAQGNPSDDSQVVALANIQSLEADLRATDRDHRLALDELQNLKVELNGARAGVLAPGTVPSTAPSAAEQELDRARSELARIRGIYTDDHPDVRAQQRQISTLERSLRTDTGASTPTRDAAAAQVRLAISRLEARVVSTQARVDLLASQQRDLRSSIAMQRSQVQRAPQVERDLAGLQRDYDAAKAQYEDLRAKQMSAQIAQNLEGDQKGERFTLLEPPVLPEYAVKPSRKKLVALGFFVSLAAAIGVALLLEMVFARVRGVNALTALTGRRPMVVIPYIATSAEMQASQLLRKRLVLILSGIGLAGVLVVHTLVVPLHTLVISLLSRFG